MFSHIFLTIFGVVLGLFVAPSQMLEIVALIIFANLGLVLLRRLDASTAGPPGGGAA